MHTWMDVVKFFQFSHVCLDISINYLEKEHTLKKQSLCKNCMNTVKFVIEKKIGVYIFLGSREDR